MPVLELEKLEKHFGGLAAVNGVTMKVDDGEILAIVGPNGAGKSTLLKMIVGLEAPSGGNRRGAAARASHSNLSLRRVAAKLPLCNRHDFGVHVG